MCGLYFQNFSNPYLHFTEPGEGDEVLFTLPMKPEAMITGFDVTDTGPAVLAMFRRPRGVEREYSPAPSAGERLHTTVLYCMSRTVLYLFDSREG